MNKTIGLTIRIALVVAILCLVYALYESIMNPIRFNKDMRKREVRVIERLKDIRTV